MTDTSNSQGASDRYVFDHCKRDGEKLIDVYIHETDNDEIEKTLEETGEKEDV